MPRLERDGLVAATTLDGSLYLSKTAQGPVMFTADDARWLLTTALPTLITSLEGPEPVPDAIRQGYAKVREG